MSSGDKSNLNVEMPNVSNEASRPVETPANPNSVCGNQDKQAHTIRCKICIESFGSIKELNIHHQADHGIVDLEMCDKKFPTQTALDKHMSHFSYMCKMQCLLNLVLESWEYLWFYLTFWIAILDCGLKLHKLSIYILVMLQK